MIKIPRIALIRPIENEALQIEPILRRKDYSLRVVNEISEILELISDEGDTFDVVVLTSKIHDGTSPINAIVKLKTEAQLATIPILLVSFAKEKASLQSFYGAGADMVLLAPVEAEYFYWQVISLARSKRSYEEQLSLLDQKKGLRDSSIAALNTTREALLLFDLDLRLVFINDSCRVLLGLGADTSANDIEPYQKQFAPILAQYAAQQPVGKTGMKSTPAVNTYTMQVSGHNVKSFPASLRLSPIYQESAQQISGYSLCLRDNTEILQLSNLLIQAKRASSMLMLMSSAARILLDQKEPEAVLAPLSKLQHILDSEPLTANLGKCLNFLLELFDQVSSPDISIKVNGDLNVLLAVRNSDLFRLLGGLLSCAVDHAIGGGEVLLETSRVANHEQIVIASTAKRSTALLAHDEIADLIRGHLHIENQIKTDKPMGLALAENLAQKYGESIEFQTPNPAKLKTRIKLPLVLS